MLVVLDYLNNKKSILITCVNGQVSLVIKNFMFFNMVLLKLKIEHFFYLYWTKFPQVKIEHFFLSLLNQVSTSENQLRNGLYSKTSIAVL